MNEMSIASVALSVLADAAVKSAAVLLLAWAVTLTMRHASAAARHLVWSAAITVTLALPVASRLLPTYRLAILSPPAAPIAGTVVSPRPAIALHLSGPPSTDRPPVEEAPIVSRLRPQPAPPVDTELPATMMPASPAPAVATPPKSSPIRTPRIVLLIWSAGTTLLVLWWALGLIAAGRLGRRCTVATSGVAFDTMQAMRRDLRLRREVTLGLGDVPMPLTSGFLFPSVLLPTTADHWPLVQLRSVLLHELSHVKRFDCATQSLAQLALAAYWFNPLVWLAAARLRVERERACDDLVLSHGASPATYAEQLVTIARLLQGRSLPHVAAVGMARPAGLRRRVCDILDAKINRRSFSARLGITIVAVAAILLIPLGSLRLTSRQAAAATTRPSMHPNPIKAALATTRPTTNPLKSLQLIVVDDVTGKPLPGVQVEYDARPKNGHTVTDENGRAKFDFASSRNQTISLQQQHYVPLRLNWNRGGRPEAVPASYVVKLEPGVAIGGKVVDDVGQPIEDAHVVIYVNAPRPQPREHDNLIFVETKSKADGTWNFDAVPEKFINFELGVWDYAHVANEQGGASFEMRECSDLQELRNHAVNLVLPRGVTVAGVVHGPDGKPVVGARVGYGGDRIASNVVPAFRTGGDGAFLFAFKPDTAVVLTAMAKSFSPEMLRVTAGVDTKAMTINLTPGHLLEGRVMHVNGSPVVNAFVSLDTWRGTRTLEGKVLRTDSTGTFRWSDAPGDTILANFGDQAGGRLAGQNRVPIVAGRVNVITLGLSVHVTGTVTDAVTGKPIPEFKLFHGESFSDSVPPSFDGQGLPLQHDGKFEFWPEYPYPIYGVRVEARGYLTIDSHPFRDADHEVWLDLKLQPAADWRPKILLPDGKPMAGATAILLLPGQSPLIFTGRLNSPFVEQWHQKFISAPDGTLDVPPQSTPALIVVIDKAGYGQANEDVLKANGAIHLQAWAHVHGTLKIGSAIAGNQTVSVEPATTESFDRSKLAVMNQMTAKTDSQGKFGIDFVPPGSMHIGRQVQVGNGRMVMTILAGSTAVDLAPGQTVDVTIGGNGRTVIGKMIVPPELASGKNWSWSDTSMFASVMPIPTLSEPDNIKAAPPEQRAKMVAEFKQTPAYLNYRAKLKAFRNDRRAYPVEQSADGSFRVTNVEPGTYGLNVSIVGGPPDDLGMMNDSLAEGMATVTVPPITAGGDSVPVVVPPVEMKMTLQTKVGATRPGS